MPKTYPPEPRMSNETFLSGYYANMTQLLSNIQQETFNKLYSVDQSTVKPNYKFLYRTQHMRKWCCIAIALHLTEILCQY